MPGRRCSSRAVCSQHNTHCQLVELFASEGRRMIKYLCTAVAEGLSGPTPGGETEKRRFWVCMDICAQALCKHCIILYPASALLGFFFGQRTSACSWSDFKEILMARAICCLCRVNLSGVKFEGHCKSLWTHDREDWSCEKQKAI